MAGGVYYIYVVAVGFYRNSRRFYRNAPLPLYGQKVRLGIAAVDTAQRAQVA